MNRRGFTIVELLIVIAIMGILLVLGVVNLRGSQANARDSERKIDVENIALALETDYVNSTPNSVRVGTYVSTSTSSSSNSNIMSILQDIDIKSLLAPGITDETYKSFISATNNDQTTSGVLPQPDINQYVYQPLMSNGNLCNSSANGCCKYNIFYHLEVDDSIEIYRSKNQC